MRVSVLGPSGNRDVARGSPPALPGPSYVCVWVWAPGLEPRAGVQAGLAVFLGLRAPPASRQPSRIPY